jgi:tRNA(adenine34) deaminase
MRQALELAAKAEQCNEVPVGALVVSEQGEIVGRGWNRPISSSDPTAHAEVVALREAAQNIENYRLVNCTLYVTLEPCTMCCGALIHARIKTLVYGATEPKAGAVKSHLQLLDLSHTNHSIDVLSGICEEECAVMLSAFFKRRREEKREIRKELS